MRDELDQLLDSALGTYSKKEPWSGLDDRVLSRVRRKERRWLWAAIAVPVAAAILMAIAIMRPRVEIPVVKDSVPPTPVVEEVRHAVVTKAAKHSLRAVRTAAPKQSQFPAPAPLTEDERALLDLASRAPEVLRFRTDGPIEIEPIQIAPLDTGGGSEEPKR